MRNSLAPSPLEESKFDDLRLQSAVMKETKSPFDSSKFREFVSLIRKKRGIQSALNILNRLEVAKGFRKPSLALYDHALHVIGGAQKYGCTLAYALQDVFDVTLVANKPVSLDSLRKWYNLDLSLCSIEVVPIPYFESPQTESEMIDPARVNFKGENPFHNISRLSGDYDFFVNNSMLEMVYPLANRSIFICHFPERERSRFFHVDKYSEIIFNSLYTARWIQSRWGLSPHFHLSPPVDMEEMSDDIQKQSLLLSVSRFDPGGNKQQVEMIRTFRKLVDRFPGELGGWRFVLAGGSVDKNRYLDRVKTYLKRWPALDISVRVNLPVEELKALYKKAKIFWHFCGLNQTDPAKVEHFGMNIVEAMQNGCVPLVFDGGGQAEIVEEGISGFRFSDAETLIGRTIDLIRDPQLRNRMSKEAELRGEIFHRDVFVGKVREHFEKLLNEYRYETDS